MSLLDFFVPVILLFLTLVTVELLVLGAIVLVVYFYLNKDSLSRIVIPLIFLSGFLLFFVIGTLTKGGVMFIKDDYLNYFQVVQSNQKSIMGLLLDFSIGQWVIAFGVGLVGCVFWLLQEPITSERVQNTMNNKMKKELKAAEEMDIDLESMETVFAVGTVGSGKTACLLRYAERYIASERFTVIVDGKGDNTQYSLYDVVKQLCQLYQRELIIIDQSDLLNNKGYNPFKDISNTTQIKDMLINMSDWTEEHYKSLTARYYLHLTEALIKKEGQGKITLEKIIKYSSVSEFKNLMTELAKQYNDPVSVEQYRVWADTIKTCGTQAQVAASRLRVYLDGAGQSIFSSNGFNMLDAYKRNAVVLVKLNAFIYTDFARGLGRLFLEDCKNLIGYKLAKGGHQEPSLFLLDELTVYFYDGLIEMINKSRTAKVKYVLATQSLADLEKVSREAKDQVIENSNAYIVLRLNTQKSAEEMANVIGTRKAIQQTHQTDRSSKTGVGTTKVVDEYVVNPNEIKSLPKNYGYYYDKTLGKAYLFKTRFVDPTKKKDFN